MPRPLLPHSHLLDVLSKLRHIDLQESRLWLQRPLKLRLLL